MKPTCRHGNANGPCNACRTERIHAIQAARIKASLDAATRESHERWRAISLARASGRSGPEAARWAEAYLVADEHARRGMILDLDASEVR